MKGALLMRQCSTAKSRARFATAAFTGAALAYQNEDFRENVNNTILGQQLIANECGDGTTAEEAAADLDKIFKESGGMLSQEELMEMVMKKKNQLKPQPFDKVCMQYLGMYKQQVEIADGLNMSAFMPLGNNFQLGGAWHLSNEKGAAFELTTAINNATPRSAQDDVQSGQFKFLSDGTGMVAGAFNLPYGIVCATQTMYNDTECQQVINMLILDKSWRDCNLQYRFQGMAGQGVHTWSFMQSLNQQFQAGFQLNMIPNTPTKFAYAGLYQTGQNNKHQFALGYNPMSPREAIQIAYLTKPSQRLQLFSELKGSFDGSTSLFMAGFKLRFLQGAISGYMDTKWKLHSSFTKVTDEMAAIPLKMEWFTMIDFAAARRPCRFGMAVSLGAQ